VPIIEALNLSVFVMFDEFRHNFLGILGDEADVMDR
jgi:hypothetical protein